MDTVYYNLQNQAPLYYSTIISHRFFADPYEIYKLELINFGESRFIAIQKYAYKTRLNQYCHDTGLLFDHSTWARFLRLANLFTEQYLNSIPVTNTAFHPRPTSTRNSATTTTSTTSLTSPNYNGGKNVRNARVAKQVNCSF